MLNDDEDDRSELNSAISSLIRALLVSRVDVFLLSSPVISRRIFNPQSLIAKREIDPHCFLTRLKRSEIVERNIFSTRIAVIYCFLPLYLDRIMYA